MGEIVFFINLDSPKHIELVKLFRDYSEHEPWVYYSKSDKSRVWNALGNVKIWDRHPRTIRGKTIALGGYSDYFLDIDSSNNVIYLAQKPTLDHNEILLLGKIDHVIAENQFDAFSLSYQIKYHNPRITVSHLPPWIDTSKYSVNGYSDTIETGDPAWMSKSLAKFKPKKKDFYLGTKSKFVSEPKNLYQAMQYLLTGRPILASRRYQSLITPGFNGYLADDLSEAMSAVNAFSDSAHLRQLGLNGRSEIIAKLDPYRYLSEFDKILSGKIPNLAPYKFRRDFKDRKWIVQERTLSKGGIVKWPDKYHSSFKTVDLEDFTEIIEYFSKQLFSDVYVFGFHFPEYDRHEMRQARSVVNRLGDRGKHIHFCLDEPIPEIWIPVFDKLSVVSEEEGLKQIR